MGALRHEIKIEIARMDDPEDNFAISKNGILWPLKILQEILGLFPCPSSPAKQAPQDPPLNHLAIEKGPPKQPFN